MNFLGKMLTVMITVMSIIFMSFAVMVFATHKNWRQAALNPTATATMDLGLKPQLVKEKERTKELETEKQQILSVFAAEQAAREIGRASCRERVYSSV